MFINLLKKIFTVIVLTLVILLVPANFLFNGLIPIVKADGAVRGTSGDLWADKEFGKRDFTEDVPRQVVPDKVSSPGGVIVDRNTSVAHPKGVAYIWDSGNSRILGVDLKTCYDLLDASNNNRCAAFIVFGQPSLTDWGSCNQDASAQFAPNKAPSSASTLCGIPEWTHTTLEHKSFSSMYVDSSGDLFVADFYNHRVLEFYNPLSNTGPGTNDTVADQVWGQTDFAGNLCNKSGSWNAPFGVAPGPPSGNSLCFETPFENGAGVTLDASGNLWVADGGNDRVLRFKNNAGTISKTADIVIGRTDFTSGGAASGGSGLNQLSAPTSVAFDSSGRLYVSDTGNNRVIRYNTPLVTGESGTVILNNSNFANHGIVVDVQMDPTGTSFYTYENNDIGASFNKWDLSAVAQIVPFNNWNPGGGSIGIDTDGNLLISAYVSEQDVVRYEYNGGTNTFDSVENLYYPPLGYNLTSANRLEQGGWGGVGIESNGQMVVTDGRMLFWNNPLTEASGADPDGAVGSSGVDFTKGFVLLAVDKDDKIYVQQQGVKIGIYQGPVTTSTTSISVLSPPFNVLGGGTINVQNIGGIAVSNHGEYLWLTDPDLHRALRIKDPLGTPVVDMVLGQTNLSGTSCNQGAVGDPTLNMLCHPGQISFDKLGNLYISDDFFETVGNFRLLMYAKATIAPTIDPASVVFAPNAAKEFPAYGVHGSVTSHITFQPAFTSTNIMVVGYNPYLGPRFLDYYNNPTSFNPSNRSDPSFALPDGSLKDFYGWVYSMVFDKDNNLYAYDVNRGKVNVYLQPFGPTNPTVTEVSPVSTPTMDSTPNYTFNTDRAGTISYGGACQSSTTIATAGNNTITFNKLPIGNYTNCSITITDNFSNVSSALHVSNFAVSFKPVGDFNSDGVVDLSDLSILSTYWQTSNSIADANNDGIVDLSDLSILAQHWQETFN